ncbi:MAG TPA: universal stress protein [Solirubrobacterales bacterium]|jgi:nucleotide-binding universal stress UspA family protein|nr:universal stress protein [Solirubrobacterales bacterium]
MSVYHHILVALDGSADSTTALRHALTLAADQNAKLTLMTVVPHTPTPVGPGVATPPETDEGHNAILKEALAIVPHDIGVTTRLEHGEIADTILRLVATDGYDLLVMGSHGHGRVHRALLGSVSERVLHKAAVPVLMLRSHCQA